VDALPASFAIGLFAYGTVIVQSFLFYKTSNKLYSLIANTKVRTLDKQCAKRNVFHGHAASVGAVLASITVVAGSDICVVQICIASRKNV
jgi:GMP synthase-like glutamine amidotransferase